jgi:sugar lactone lactonase YvrE
VSQIPLRSSLACLLAVSAVGVTAWPSHAADAGSPVSRARVIDRFDGAKGQLPENITLEPDGAVDLTFAAAHQVARVTPDGTVAILATLPAPADGGIHTPVLGSAFSTGLARAEDGTLYIGYAAGDSSLTGIWRLRPGATAPERIAALPADSLPNGLALDRETGTLYTADSARGVIWRVPAAGGIPAIWSAASQLAPAGFLGANGIKVHRGAVWATSYDDGLLLRIPIAHDGSAGAAEVRAADLKFIDDFSFIDGGDRVLAAINGLQGPSEVALVQPDGTHTIVLTAADGLQNPTSVAVRGSTFYVPSADYANATHPNLLEAHIQQR